MTYFTGKGYGVSKYIDVTGVPLLSYTLPDTKEVITLFDRVAVQVDPTIKQALVISQIDGGRMDQATSSALKKAVGGTSAEELDHIISLELGGSNQIANLGLDTNTPGTTNNPTDTFENKLGAAVQAGSMSLLEAWRAEATSKGKVIAEDLRIKGDTSLITAAESALGGAWQALTSGTRNDLNSNIQAQISQDKDVLAKTPYDIPTRRKIFMEQINLTSEQLNLSQADAASYMKVYTARYAQSTGQNPIEMFGAMTANEQQIMGVSGQEPNLLGIKVIVWVNVAAAALAGQAIVGFLGIIGLIIVMFVGAPEEVVAAEAGGSILSFLTKLGLTGARLKVGVIGWSTYEFLGAMDTRIPMITKQLLDTKYIVPSLISTALKNDYDVLAKIGKGTTTKTATTSTAAPSYPPTGGGVATSSVSGTSVHVSVVSGGVLGSPATFTPATSDIFENMSEMQIASEENLAKYIGALPGQLAYELRLVGKITLADGTVRIGTTQHIIKGYTKGSAKVASRPEYKKVTNKFIVADVKYKSLAGAWKKLDEIVIGAVDETGFQPTTQDLAGLGDAISTYLVANHLGGVTQINLPTSASGQPTQTTAAQIPAPTTTPSIPAPKYSANNNPYQQTTADQANGLDAMGLAPDVWNANVAKYGIAANNVNGISLSQAAIAYKPSTAAQTPPPASPMNLPTVAPAPIVSAPLQGAPNPLPGQVQTGYTPPSTAAAVPVQGLPAGVTYRNDTLYNYPYQGGLTTGLIDYLPTNLLALVYQQLGLGSSTMFTGTTGQIAAIKQKLGA